MATDNNGDFVVAWTRNDYVLDSSGAAVIDPTTGVAMTDENIYARYYTDAMQRIDLPASMAGGGNFTLQYNGNEIQQLSVSSSTAPYTSGQPTVSGTFVLAFGSQTVTVGFNEATFNTGAYTNSGATPWTNPLNDPALNLQAALRSLGGALGDVTVEGTDADNFQINFGSASKAQSQPLLTVANTALSGFLPAVSVTMVRQPGTTISIPVSNNTALTAAAELGRNGAEHRVCVSAGHGANLPDRSGRICADGSIGPGGVARWGGPILRRSRFGLRCRR